jgi:transcriptional regulator with XRE-family HTH domain/mannose-6-phosphate isomerase-like protein (cupin superfamily)
MLAGDVAPDLDEVGGRLRRLREQRGIGVRELARRVNVSGSLVSQIEMGKSKPSVETLYRIVSELGVSLDQVFGPRPQTPSGQAVHALAESAASGWRDTAPPRHIALDPQGLPDSPVQREDRRPVVKLASGVRWERLTAAADPYIDFLWVVYEVGGASSSGDELTVHTGREYGIVLSGRLAVTVGFETYELGPGDSVSFDSTTPHRLKCIGDEPAQGIWVVIGRMGDLRTLALQNPPDQQLP